MSTVATIPAPGPEQGASRNGSRCDYEIILGRQWPNLRLRYRNHLFQW